MKVSAETRSGIESPVLIVVHAVEAFEFIARAGDELEGGRQLKNVFKQAGIAVAADRARRNRIAEGVDLSIVRPEEREALGVFLCAVGVEIVGGILHGNVVCRRPGGDRGRHDLRRRQ